MAGNSANPPMVGDPGTLTVTVPGVLSISFDPGTLDEALEQFEDWAKGDFDSATAEQGLVTDLLQALVEESPVDPVAGNPNSLQSRMFGSDFRLGSQGPFTSSEGSLKPSTNLVGLGLRTGRHALPSPAAALATVLAERPEAGLARRAYLNVLARTVPPFPTSSPDRRGRPR